ncbi:MAG: hypothetical protein KGZ25_03500 [Planctomycetes bacterium]|nr:hypothetical protein [Planctomycetota bacterium]
MYRLVIAVAVLALSWGVVGCNREEPAETTSPTVEEEVEETGEEEIEETTEEDVTE